MIASVILFINEVELFIYRFLSSGVKNSKRYPRPIELGVNWITSRWTLNALTSYRCLDRTSTEKGVNLNWEEKAIGWERVFLTLLDRTSTRQGEPVDWFPNRLAIALTGWAFWPQKPSFLNSFLFYYLGKVFRWINMPVLKHFA